MNNVSRYLTAVAFSLAGVAAHANAAVEQNSCGSSTCFQLAPVAKPGSEGLIAADGASRTPQGQTLAADGSSRTPQGQTLAADGSSRTPQGQTLAADGSSRTPQGQTLAENGASRTPQSQWLESQTA
ncbi:hypothetical protein K7459_03090 [Pseudomonas fluorescens]|uniref:Uncharacterized protein n=1 Tax=Pseudomonas fluorescens (strain Pf0-1) TaxID=205922 RepID=Q3K462_PSEPF|nr:hypothetical protein [Pseudomonas fluorescens]ABA77442.1 hypothetical protein Pfl01_5706 [Pseudomonas fluorescens Pf0-1]MBY9022634.1 hypothetical protein [Pseudomonas fluorescens]MBY9028626.1 hypothetical protein [Pseudomonas fluorescens]MBY9033815.1 hypothetical protein [Pseudomonas fluorescens]MBY9040276.1 hypothetical protein [Pseudomonas fluorescens]